MLIKRARYGVGLPRVPSIGRSLPTAWRSIFKTTPKPPVFMYGYRVPKPPKALGSVRGAPAHITHPPQIHRKPQSPVNEEHVRHVERRTAGTHPAPHEGTENKSMVSEDVAKTMRQMGLTNGGGWVNPVTHEKWVMVKGVAVKSIPPHAEVEGTELKVRLNPDVIKRYASLSDNGRIDLAVNLDNNRSVLVLTFDKNGKLITPKKELEQMGVQVLPDGTIVIDTLKALPEYYVKRVGGPHQANVSLWGHFDGINMPVSGVNVKFKR